MAGLGKNNPLLLLDIIRVVPPLIRELMVTRNVVLLSVLFIGIVLGSCSLLVNKVK